MRLIFFTGATLLSLAGCAAEPSADGPVVTITDFEAVVGDDWVGGLTYVDYSTSERVTIPTSATVSISSPTTLKYSVSYPKEPWEDTKAKLKLSKSGRMLDGHPVTYREIQPNGLLEIRTSHQGEDNNMQAQVRMTYVINESEFAISKDVRLNDDVEFVNRNIYSFTRP